MNKKKIIALFLVVLLLSPVMVLAQTVTSLDEITSTTPVDNTQTTGTPVTESPVTKPEPSSTTTTTTEVTVQETPAPVTPVTPVDKSTGKLVGDIFGDLAPDDASLGKAGVVLSPMLNALQTYLSYAILIIVGLQVFLISIDLIFLGFPFVRGFLLKSLEDGSLSNSASNIAQGGVSPMGMGMGMSPMGGMGRMGGYGGSRYGSGRMGLGMGMAPPMAMGGGMSGYGSPQVSTPFGELAKSRFISDSAVSAFFESMDALQAGAVQSLNPMSGIGAGGQQVSSKSPKFKDMISIYIRRHAWFIILFSATLIIFTSPVLFQLGFKLGQFIIDALGSLV